MTKRKDKGVAKSAALSAIEKYRFFLTIVSFSIPTNYWKKVFRKDQRIET
jgi:hypothetical protein